MRSWFGAQNYFLLFCCAACPYSWAEEPPVGMTFGKSGRDYTEKTREVFNGKGLIFSFWAGG